MKIIQIILQMLSSFFLRWFITKRQFPKTIRRNQSTNRRSSNFGEKCKHGLLGAGIIISSMCIGYYGYPEHIEYWKPLYLHEVTRNNFDIKCVPSRYYTQELWEVAIRENPGLIDYLPTEYESVPFFMYMRESEYIRRIKLNKIDIRNIPSKYHTEKLWEEAIIMNHKLISYLPTEYKTAFFFETILYTNRSFSYYIPMELREQVLQGYFDAYTRSGKLFKEIGGLVLTGSEFNKLIEGKNIQFYKFLESDEESNKHQYVPGLNIDSKHFDPLCDCCPGGLYFANSENMRKHLWQEHKYIRVVTVPNDQKIWVKIEDGKLKATQLMLGSEKIRLPILYYDDVLMSETDPFLVALDDNRFQDWIKDHPYMAEGKERSAWTLSE